MTLGSSVVRGYETRSARSNPSDESIGLLRIESRLRALGSAFLEGRNDEARVAVRDLFGTLLRWPSALARRPDPQGESAWIRGPQHRNQAARGLPPRSRPG